MTPSPPGFLRHLLELWWLRAAASANARGYAAPVSYALSAAPGIPLAYGSYSLITWTPVAESPLWLQFAMGLCCFVTVCLGVLQPILAAGVDDHSEMRRYAAFPIAPFRVLVASTVAELAEPVTLVVYAPLAGATLGYLEVRELHAAWAVLPLFAAFAIATLCWSRVGLYWTLSLLRQQKSAEAIGGGMLFFIAVSLLLPPVDISWLQAVAGGLGAVSDQLIIRAARGLSRFPTGLYAEALRALGDGRLTGAFVRGLLMLTIAVPGLTLALRAIEGFRRGGSRARGASAPGASRNPFVSAKDVSAALRRRDLLELWRNARARLLLAVPYLLMVLVGLLSGRALFAHFLGPATDAWLLGGLALYGVVAFASTFTQNAFGYDGPALAALVAAPVTSRQIVESRNRVHALALLTLGTSVTLSAALYYGAGAWTDVGLALLAVAVATPLLITAGNFASITWPARFHASLERRDQQPRPAIATGVLAASAACAPFALVLRSAWPDGLRLALLALVAAAAWALWWATLPLYVRYFDRRREQLIQVLRGDG